ncbi:MAG TPA: ATP-binding protein [Vicinamibacterales bacterium]|nr:ATP-binding protein [Vicinamibacterales bacterium]
MKIDLSGPIKASLDKAVAEARAHQQAGRLNEAAAAFIKAAGLMNSYGEYALTRSDEVRRRLKARTYLQVAEQLRAGGGGTKPRRPAPAPSGPTGSSGAGQHESQPDAEQEEQTSAIEALIYRSPATWDQIGGLDETKREIKFAYGLALAAKPEGVALPGWRRILFYGPPGTGKTLLAAATSNGLSATFFNVKVGSLLSKYFGESSRLISTLFDVARDRADEGFSVVFVDEIESLCLPRGEGSESGAERRVLSTLLSELDGLADKGEDRSVLTIAATNAPWDLDDAILSRFQKRVFIPLPDAAARKQILGILLEKAGHQLDVPVDDLVARTEWFSGRDLERLAHQAINVMVADLNGSVPDLVDRGRAQIEGYEIKVRPLGRPDFDRAFDRIRVDVVRQKEQGQRYREFEAAN